MRFLAVQVASGLALAGVFLGALIYWSGSPARELLLDPDHAWALVAIFILHAGLFTCASFATALCAEPDHRGGGRRCVQARRPILARADARPRRPSPSHKDGI